MSTEVIYDTTFLQLQSVIRFAKMLDWGWDGRSFYKKTTTRGTVYTTFESIQNFHNPCHVWVKGGSITPIAQHHLKTTKTKFDLAQKEKLVEKSYLQYSKKLKRFVVQQNRVRLV